MKPARFKQQERMKAMAEQNATQQTPPAEVQNIDPAAPAAPAPEAPAQVVAESTQAPAAETTDAPAQTGDAPAAEAPAQEAAAEVQAAPETPAAPAPVDGVKDESTVKEAPAAEAPKVPEAPAQDTTQGDTDISEEAAYLLKVKESGTEAQKRILSAIELYCERFRHRAPVTGEQGVKWQYEFLLHALKVINSNYEEFKPAWNVLLVFFKENHGRSSVSNTSPISDGPSSRFGPYWDRGDETWAAYKNIFELLRSTRDPATRKQYVKNIVLERIGPGLISEDGLQNLRRFYQ